MDDDEFEARHAQKIREMRRRKRIQARRRKIIRKRILPLAFVLLCFAILIFTGIRLFSRNAGKGKADAENPEALPYESIQTDNTKSTGEGYGIDDSNSVADGITVDETGDAQTEENANAGFFASASENTVQLGGDIISNHAILIDLDTDTILAQKSANTRIIPASMTKVLTVLVAAENITDLDDTFTMTREVIDYCFSNDCSNAGFEEGEKVKVRDLFYGAILPSGGEAALGLAVYAAGSHEAFVELMNQKLNELGLSESAHFTNCVGLYDEAHYCTIYDMAIIMEAAIANDFCREVMSAHLYYTEKTPEHPEGLELSNWFLRRIEDKDTGGEVVCGKTGYVVQSGSCAVSYARNSSGKGYICATADANSGWRCIYDHVALYKQYMESTGTES